MDYALQPHLYKNVPVYLWPWVWWQLFQIERWIKETGRMVLGGVARDGKVYVLHVADDPSDPKPWSPGDLRPLKGRHQDWIAALSKLSPSLSRHGCERKSLCTRRARWFDLAHHRRATSGSQVLHAYDPTRHGDQILLAMRLLEWPLINTSVGCNEPLRIAPFALAPTSPIQISLQSSIFPGLTRDLVRQVRTRGTRTRIKSGAIGTLNTTTPPSTHPRARPHVLQLPRTALETPQ